MRRIQLAVIALVAFFGFSGFVSYTSVTGKWVALQLGISLDSSPCDVRTVLDLRQDGTFTVGYMLVEVIDFESARLPQSESVCKNAQQPDRSGSVSGTWSLLPEDRSTGLFSVLKEKVILDLNYGAGSPASYKVIVSSERGKSTLTLTLFVPKIFQGLNLPKPKTPQEKYALPQILSGPYTKLN